MPHIPGHNFPSPLSGFGNPTPRQYAIHAQATGRTPVERDTSRSFSDLLSDITAHPLSWALPVAGTAMHWNEMRPWERGLSVTADALDIATLGGGKVITAPLKAAARFATRNDPALTYVRGGYLPDGTSINHFSGNPELGVSTYQALKFDSPINDARYYMRPMSSNPVIHDLPKDHAWYGRHYYDEATNSLKERDTYSITPIKGQQVIYEERPLYELSGKPLSSLGADREALLDVNSVRYKNYYYHTELPLQEPLRYPRPNSIQEFYDKRPNSASPGWSLEPRIAPNRNVRLYIPEGKGFWEMHKPTKYEAPNMAEFYGRQSSPTITDPVTGKVYNLESEFAKYNEMGLYRNPLLRMDHIVEPYLNPLGINNLWNNPGTLPVTELVRAYMAGRNRPEFSLSGYNEPS